MGETEAAKALATVLGARLIRLQCYEGLDVAHAVYEWNYPRQLLHIRAAQEGTLREEELFGPEYLIRRPLLEAIDGEEPVVLLIDEIDRADEEFEAFLLEVLSDFQITIPELGTIRARRRPAVILTSNRTRGSSTTRSSGVRCSTGSAIRRSSARSPSCAFASRGSPSGSRPRPRPSCASSAGSTSRSRRAGRDDRLGDGPERARPQGDRRRGRRADPRLGAQVPRGHRCRPGRDAVAARRGRAPRPRRADGMPAGDAILSHVVTFGRVLHEAGLEVGPGRVADALRALDSVDLARQEDVYFSLRQTLVSRHDELELFDRAFSAWFLRAPVLPAVRTRSAMEQETRVGQAPTDRLRAREADEDGDRATRSDSRVRAGAAARQGLRGADGRRAAASAGADRPNRPHAAAAPLRRRTADPRGDRLDVRRMIRRSLRAGRRPARPSVPHAQEGPAKARGAMRRLRVDGQLRTRPAAVPARRRRNRPRRRGVRLRHPPLALDGRPPNTRPGRGAGALHRGGRRLGQQDADRRLLREFNEVSGDTRFRAGRLLRRLRRLGTRRP